MNKFLEYPQKYTYGASFRDVPAHLQLFYQANFRSVTYYMVKIQIQLLIPQNIGIEDINKFLRFWSALQIHVRERFQQRGISLPCLLYTSKKLRRCEVCGTGILARSGRAKYCPACAKEVHRQQKAKSARKRRSGVDNLGAKSP